MFYEAYIVVCLNSTPVGKCDKTTAVDVITQIEDSPNEELCGLTAQIEAAKSSRVDRQVSYAKIFCTPGGRIATPVPDNAS